jgi:hypothetical protein
MPSHRRPERLEAVLEELRRIRESTMMLAELGAVGQSFIAGGNCAADSFPSFQETLKALLVPRRSTRESRR